MPIRHAKVYLVGAGPGNPGFLTLRGAAVLAEADVVIYDHLAHPRLLDLAPRQAQRIRAGKSVGHCTMTQDQIHQALIENARAGRTVVRLKGGDPLLFGRGAEEALFLQAAGIPFEIIPGVTAGLGATSYAGIPVTHRGLSSAVAYVTGHRDPEAVSTRLDGLDWPALARFPGTLVVYMGVTHLAAICRTLIREGMSAETPAAIIASGTLPWQQTLVATLSTIAALAQQEGIRPPALLVVGPIVALRNRLTWYDRLPLFGQRILVTRPPDEASKAAAHLEALGAEVLCAPTVQVRPITDPGPLDAAIDRLPDYHWLVFTSSNGVRFFLERLLQTGRDLRVLGHLKLAAIGPVTAEALAGYHLRADLVPEEFRSESLAVALGQAAEGSRILLARADRGRTLLKDELQHLADVDQVAVYHNVDAESLPDHVLMRIEAGTIDWVTLTSSAIASRFHALLSDTARQRIGQEVRLASLSPVTSATVAHLGWPVALEASVFTWEGLVDSLVERISAERGNVDQPSD
jgi:uroporphyrinogen III methyltransferase/synthase